MLVKQEFVLVINYSCRQLLNAPLVVTQKPGSLICSVIRTWHMVFVC